MSCITCGLEVSRVSCGVIVNPQRRRFTGLGYDETIFKVHDVRLGFFTYGTKGTKSVACLWWHNIRKDSVHPGSKIDYQAIAVFNGHKVLSRDTIAVLRSKGETGPWKQHMAAMERDMKKEYLRRITAAASAKAIALSSLEVGAQPILAGPPAVQGQRRTVPTTLVRQASAVSSNASIRTLPRPRPVQRQVAGGSPLTVSGAAYVMYGDSANASGSVAQHPVSAPEPSTRPTHLSAQQALPLQGGMANVIAVPIMPSMPARVVPASARPSMPGANVGRQSAIQQIHSGGRERYYDPPPAYEPPPAYSLNGTILIARTVQAQQDITTARPPAMNPAPAVVPNLPPLAPAHTPLVSFEAPSVAAAPPDFIAQRRRIAGRGRASQTSRQIGRFANVDPLLPAAQAVLPAISQPFLFTLPATAPAMPTTPATVPAAPAPVIRDQPDRATSSASFGFDDVADNIERAAPVVVIQEQTALEVAAPAAPLTTLPERVDRVPAAVEAQVALALADSIVLTPARSRETSFAAEEALQCASPSSEEIEGAVDAQLRAPAPGTIQLPVAAARPTWFTRHFLQAVARLAFNPLAQGRATFG